MKKKTTTAADEKVYPDGLRGVTAEDVKAVGDGPWYGVTRPFREGRPIDQGEVISGFIFATVDRRKTFAADVVVLPELMRVGVTCEGCGSVFTNTLRAMAHRRLRHSAGAEARDAAEAQRQADRDEADRIGREDSQRRYGHAVTNCWACGSSVPPGTHIEPKPEGFVSTKPRSTFREVAALPSQPPPAA